MERASGGSGTLGVTVQLRRRIGQDAGDTFTVRIDRRVTEESRGARRLRGRLQGRPRLQLLHRHRCARPGPLDRQDAACARAVKGGVPADRVIDTLSEEALPARPHG
jgi:hypothetical protein